MKLLKNETYNKLISERDTAIKNLDDVNKQLDYQLHVNKKLEILVEDFESRYVQSSIKAAKYDKLQADRKRYRAKKVSPEHEDIAFIKANIGKEVKCPAVGVGELCGYAEFGDNIGLRAIIGLSGNVGWTELQKGDIIIKTHKRYWYLKMEEVRK